jgi:enoyl-CoA hydratase
MADATQDLVNYAVRDGVGRITLTRAQYRNAQSVQLLHDLDAAFTRAAADDDVRVIVLDADGSAFSAGHDLGTPDEQDESAFRARARHLEMSGRSWELYTELNLRWRELPKPTIAAVQGYCIYAGWSIASAMDIVIAADDAQFLPHLSEYFSLPWIIGPRRAKQVLFANRMLDATTALELGMASEVVPRADLSRRVDALAMQIASGDPGVLRLIKGAVNAVEDGMGFGSSIRIGQAYNVLAYHERVAEPKGTGRAEIPRVREALQGEEPAAG